MLTSTNLYTGFALNVAVALLIVRGIYYPSKPNKNYVVTFMAFNTLIFFVMSLLTSIEVSIGAGFGLFAIFSIDILYFWQEIILDIIQNILIFQHYNG